MVPPMRSFIACTLLIAFVLNYGPACRHAMSKPVQSSFVPDTLAELQQRQGIVPEGSRTDVWQGPRFPSGRGGLEWQMNLPHKWAVDTLNNQQDKPPTLELFPLFPEAQQLASGSPTALEQLSETRDNSGAAIAERPSKRLRIASVHQKPQHPERIDESSPTAPVSLKLSLLLTEENHPTGRGGADYRVRPDTQTESPKAHQNLPYSQQHATSLKSISEQNEGRPVRSPSFGTLSHPITALTQPTRYEQHSGSSGVHHEFQLFQPTYSTQLKVPVTLNLLHSKSEEILLNGVSSPIQPQGLLDNSPQSIAPLRSMPFQDQWMTAYVNNLGINKPSETKPRQVKEKILSRTLMKRPPQPTYSPLNPYSSGHLPELSMSRVNVENDRASFVTASVVGTFKDIERPRPEVVQQLLENYPSLTLRWKPDIICQKASCAAGVLASTLLQDMTKGPCFTLLWNLHNSHGIIIPFTYNIILKNLAARNWEMVKIVWNEFWELMELRSQPTTYTYQGAEILREFLWIAEFISECTIPWIFEKNGSALKDAQVTLETSQTGVAGILICSGLSQLAKALSAGHKGEYSLAKHHRRTKLESLIGILKHECSTYQPDILSKPVYSQALNNELLEKLGKLSKKIQEPSSHLRVLKLINTLDKKRIQMFEQMVKSLVFRNSIVKERTLGHLSSSIQEKHWKPFISQLSGPSDHRAKLYSASLAKIPRSTDEMLKHLYEVIHFGGELKPSSYLPAKIHNFLKNYDQGDL